MPDFWDYEYDFDAGLTDAEELSVMQQAEHIINRVEHGQPAFSDDERNLIVNYAYKLGNVENKGACRTYLCTGDRGQSGCGTCNDRCTGRDRRTAG